MFFEPHLVLKEQGHLLSLHSAKVQFARLKAKHLCCALGLILPTDLKRGKVLFWVHFSTISLKHFLEHKTKTQKRKKMSCFQRLFFFFWPKGTQASMTGTVFFAP